MKKRWRVTISYMGQSPVEYYIDEMHELQDIVEAGPEFHKLTNIKFEYLL